MSRTSLWKWIAIRLFKPFTAVSVPKPKSTTKRVKKTQTGSAAIPVAIPGAGTVDLEAAAAAASAVIVSAAENSRMGPMLKRVMSRIADASSPAGLAQLALHTDENVGTEAILPISLSLPRIEVKQGEGWKHYKERVINT